MPKEPLNKIYHVINIPEREQEFLSGLVGEQVNKLIAARIAGKGLGAMGEAVKGAVSHPVGFLAVSAALTAFLVGYFGGGEKKEEELTELLKQAYPDIPPEFFTVWEATWNITRALFPFLPGFPDIGLPPVTPPSEKEKLCAQLAKELALAQENLLLEPGQADFWEKAIKDIAERQAEAGC